MVTLTSRILTDDEPAAAANGHNPPPALATLGDDTARDLVQLFKLLADETRLRIMYYLMQHDELNVRTLCRLLRQSQPAVSHHLALMREDGIIACRRDGKHNFYHIVPKRFQTYLDLIFGANRGETKRVRIDSSINHSLRRIGAKIGKTHELDQEKMLGVTYDMLKDFHRLVLVPRQASSANTSG